MLNKKNYFTQCKSVWNQICRTFYCLQKDFFLQYFSPSILVFEKKQCNMKYFHQILQKFNPIKRDWKRVSHRDQMWHKLHSHGTEQYWWEGGHCIKFNFKYQPIYLYNFERKLLMTESRVSHRLRLWRFWHLFRAVFNMVSLKFVPVIVHSNIGDMMAWIIFLCT